jgi:hypothetical protein
MTKQQAFKAAQNMYGKKAAVRDNNRGPSFQAARDEARARIAAQGPRGKGEAAKTWDDATREDRATVRYYRYAVGYIMPMLGCFLIRGEGDTWAEAIESAKRQEVVA